MELDHEIRAQGLEETSSTSWIVPWSRAQATESAIRLTSGEYLFLVIFSATLLIIYYRWRNETYRMLTVAVNVKCMSYFDFLQKLKPSQTRLGMYIPSLQKLCTMYCLSLRSFSQWRNTSMILMIVVT